MFKNYVFLIVLVLVFSLLTGCSGKMTDEQTDAISYVENTVQEGTSLPIDITESMKEKRVFSRNNRFCFKRV